MQYLNRRSFIKTVIIGTAGVSLCPDSILGAGRGAAARELGGEHFELCHQVRDGRVPPAPAVSRRVGVAIIGGGPSGLMAAYSLRDQDFLLLEKEPHLGGNAYRQSWRGVPYSTAGAFLAEPSEEVLGALNKAGLKPLPIDDRDAVMLNGKWAADFWGDGLDQLGMPQSVRASFRQYQRDARAISVEKLRPQLDRKSFAEFLKPYAPEVAQFWDAFGRSEWGADAESTSALTGLRAAQPDYESNRLTFPGGLGAAAEAIAAYVGQKAPGRMINDATVYRVAHTERGRSVLISYWHSGQPQTIEAQTAIIAAPKFIALRIVQDMPPAQKAAIGRMRYEPYPVINLCFDRVVYDRAYDTWAPGRSFTDFVDADWITYHGKGDPKRPHVLTAYTPLSEPMRVLLLDDKSTLELADRVVGDIDQLMPGAVDLLSEVHIYRRGHPMHVSAPRVFTEIQPAASRPFGRIFFANTDSNGEGSDFSYATEAGVNAAKLARKVLVGRKARVSK